MPTPFDYLLDIEADGSEVVSTWRRNTAGGLMPTRNTPSGLKVTPTGASSASTLAALTAGLDQAANATAIGAKANPASGTVTVAITKTGSIFRLDFTLTAARIPVTDGAGSGSYGALKIFDFVETGLSFLGSRQNYTAFAEGAALTTAQGDAVHVLGIGTDPITTARDGTLTGTEQNVGNVTAQITNSGGTGTGTKHTGAVTAGVDGTATAADLYLNWSGSAATIDANSTIDVTGTLTVIGALLGDD